MLKMNTKTNRFYADLIDYNDPKEVEIFNVQEALMKAAATANENIVIISISSEEDPERVQLIEELIQMLCYEKGE